MAPLFDVEGDNLDLGYMNLRAQDFDVERQIVHALEAMWLQFEPYADLDFRQGFARDPDSRFWEMFVGCMLLNAGKELLHREDYPRNGGNPDLCVVDGDRRIWIEAIAPTRGDGGEDRVPELIALNEGGVVVDLPVREVQLRVTSALWTKARVFDGYRNQRIVGDGDICLIAINGGRFALLADGGEFPLAVSAVYPVGREFIRVDRQNGRLLDRGHHRDENIARAAGNIPRTAFLSPMFAHISGLIWSRASIGNMNREARPVSLVHNFAANRPMPQAWGGWDKEYAAQHDGENVRLRNILACR